MRIIDWSSDVCSSDFVRSGRRCVLDDADGGRCVRGHRVGLEGDFHPAELHHEAGVDFEVERAGRATAREGHGVVAVRSEEHTSELQSLMRISYAVFCLKKKKKKNSKKNTNITNIKYNNIQQMKRCNKYHENNMEYKLRIE